MKLQILRAGKEHLEPAAVLFDRYRQFYNQSPDLEGARLFLGQRLEKGDSAVFLAWVERDTGLEAAGFLQLYPSFTSAGMRPTWILNDLYVVEPLRKNGIGRRLLEKAVDFGKETGAKRLTLNNANDNQPARSLYESMGWKVESVFKSYTLDLG